MKKKSILSVLLALVMVFILTTPAVAATKPVTKTITFNAGTYYDEDLLSDAIIKVTNVTSMKTKDYSTYLSDDDITISGKKSKVITCKTKTTITLKTSDAFAFYMAYDFNKIKSSTVKSSFKYYSFDSLSEKVDTSKKYDKAPEGGYVIADGSTFTITKAGTYVVYVRPFQFYGTADEDYALNPVFIVVK